MQPTFVTAQGALLEFQTATTGQPEQLRDVKRGTVKTFSRKSRTRLIKLFASLKQHDVSVRFLTLTFKQNVIDPVYAEECRRRFEMRFRRRFPQGAMVWRKEQQNRGAFHFHMMVFGTGYWHWKEILRLWNKSQRGTTGGIDIKRIRSAKRLMNYVSKYVAKVSGESFALLDNSPYSHVSSGRWWGIVGKAFLPFDEKNLEIITDKGVLRYAQSIARCALRRNSALLDYNGFLLIDEALKAQQWMIEMAGKIEHHPPTKSYVL